KDLCQRLHDDVGEIVFLDSVPDTEKEMTARLNDTARFLVTLNLVRKKHSAELAGHVVKASVIKWKGQRVRLSPRDPAVGGLPAFCMIEHWLVEIGQRPHAPRVNARCS